MIESDMCENICARHEVPAIDYDACPYCRIEQLETDKKSLNIIIDQMGEDRKLCESLVEKERNRVEQLEAQLDVLRAFSVHHKAGVTFEQTRNLIEVCTEHSLVEAALKGERDE